jgi:hypothetical protein
MPIPTREEWRKLRDAAKVPRGAAKVSIGDSLAKVHKSYGLATASANAKDTDQLIKDLDAYVVTIKKKYPNFEPIVQKQVKDKAQSHKLVLDEVFKAKRDYYDYFKNLEKEWDKGNGSMKNVGAAMQPLLRCVTTFAQFDRAWERRRADLTKLIAECARTSVFTRQQKQAISEMIAELALAARLV